MSKTFGPVQNNEDRSKIVLDININRHAEVFIRKSRVLFRDAGRGVAGGQLPPQFLEDHLTLLEPGGRLCTPHYYLPPRFLDDAPPLQS